MSDSRDDHTALRARAASLQRELDEVKRSLDESLGVAAGLASSSEAAQGHRKAATPLARVVLLATVPAFLVGVVVGGAYARAPRADAPPSTAIVGPVGTAAPVSPATAPVSPATGTVSSTAPPSPQGPCRLVKDYDSQGNPHFRRVCGEDVIEPRGAPSSEEEASSRVVVKPGRVTVTGGGVGAREITRLVTSALGPIRACYGSLAAAARREGTWNLNISTDDSGNVVDARLDGPLPEPTKACVDHAMLGRTLSADTGGATAAIELTFTRRAPTELGF